MTRAIRIIAGVELVSVLRRRWVQLFSTAFGSIVVAVAWSSGSLHELGGLDGFGRTTVALVPFTLVLIPLVALLIGATGQASEPGSEAYLFAQPVTRSEVVIGKWIGELIALSIAVAGGLAIGALVLIVETGIGDAVRFLFVVLTSVLLGAAFLAVGTLIAALVPGRVTALCAAAFVWFCCVLLYDGVLLGLAQWLTGRAGGRVLFLSVFGNPTDVVRVLTLSVAGTPHVLGAAGESWYRFLGGPQQAMALAFSVLLLWTVVPLELARRAFARRDL